MSTASSWPRRGRRRPTKRQPRSGFVSRSTSAAWTADSAMSLMRRRRGSGRRSRVSRAPRQEIVEEGRAQCRVEGLGCSAAHPGPACPASASTISSLLTRGFGIGIGQSPEDRARELALSRRLDRASPASSIVPCRAMSAPRDSPVHPVLGAGEVNGFVDAPALVAPLYPAARASRVSHRVDEHVACASAPRPASSVTRTLPRRSKSGRVRVGAERLLVAPPMVGRAFGYCACDAAIDVRRVAIAQPLSATPSNVHPDERSQVSEPAPQHRGEIAPSVDWSTRSTIRAARRAAVT